MRKRFRMLIYGYVVMPEHVHLLVSEPELESLADAMHFLKLAFAKRLPMVPQVRGRCLAPNLGSTDVRPVKKKPAPFWQARYYDRNVRDAREFTVKLRYLHRNPVTRGLVKEAFEWKWSSFRHYALREMGVVEIESERTATDRETQASGGPARIFLRPDSTSPG
jgi:putative transposase